MIGVDLVDDSLPYFAYGSNMDHDQMSRRCPGASFIRRAYLPNHRLHFPRRRRDCEEGVASIRAETGCLVWGVLWQVPPADVAELDRKEGFRKADPLGGSYRKEQCTVIADGGSQVSAWTYVANDYRPNGEYMNKIIRGAECAGLPPSYLEQLKSVQTSG
jgi:cation transport regulator ChaC